MKRLYIPATMQQAKVIPLNASPLDEWITLEEAANLFKTPKHPNGIKPESLKNKVWRKELPKHAYAYGPTGWWFHKPTLMGLRSVNTSFNNAA